MDERGLANLLATVLIAAITFVLSSNYIALTQDFTQGVMPSKDLPVGTVSLSESTLEITNPTTVNIPLDSLVVSINGRAVKINESTSDKTWAPGEEISFRVPQTNYFTIDIYYDGKRVYHGVYLRSFSSTHDRLYPTLSVNVDKQSKTITFVSTDDVALCSYRVILGYPDREVVNVSGALFPESMIDEVYSSFIEFEKTGDSSKLEQYQTLTKNIPLGIDFVKANYVVVSVTDFTGKTSTRVIYIQNDPPSITIHTPSEGKIIWTANNNAAITVDATASDDFELQTVELYTDDILYLSWAPLTMIFDVNEQVPLPVGNHTIRVYAEDFAGLPGEATVNFTIKKDNPPSINITSPTNGTEFWSNQSTYTFDLTVVAHEDHELSRIDISVDGALYTTVNATGTVYTGAVPIMLPVDDNTHIITATAIDVAGLTSSDTISVTTRVDNPPQTGLIVYDGGDV